MHRHSRPRYFDSSGGHFFHVAWPRLAPMPDRNDPPPDFSVDFSVSFTCSICGKQTDDPETERWVWNEEREGWVCRQCIA